MPFTQRQVTPVFLARGDPQGIDSLADGNINVLNNIIHQLSDLSDHATDIINNITVQCENINQRTDAIVNRVKNVASTINDVPTDVKVDASVIDDPIRGFYKLENQLFTSSTRPTTMSELYEKADVLPNFDLLQPYRDDDKLNRTFYSNPNYFLELWKKQFEEAALAERQKRKEQRKARKEARKENQKPKRYVHVFTKIETRNDRIRKKAEAEGLLNPQNPEKREMAKTLSMDFNNLPLPERDSIVVDDIVKEKNVDPRLVRQSTFNPVPEENETNEAFDIPPPPPFKEDAHLQTTSTSVPPPPPPPGPLPPPPPMPLPAFNNDNSKQQPKTNNPSFLDQVKGGVQLRKAEPMPEKAVDTRSDLLSQIKAGRALKKVQKNDVVKKRASGIAGTFEDVMKDRRFAMESDSEDDTDSDDDFDWDQ